MNLIGVNAQFIRKVHHSLTQQARPILTPLILNPLLRRAFSPILWPQTILRMERLTASLARRPGP